MPSVILRDTNLQGNIIEKDSITIDGIVVGEIKAEEVIILCYYLLFFFL